MNAPREAKAARQNQPPRRKSSAPRMPSSCSPRSTRWSARARDIVSFCIGQPDFPTPPNIQDAAIAAIRAGKHGYTPSAGIDELRAAAATRPRRAARPRRSSPTTSVIGAGAKPFIAYTIASVTDYGAERRGDLSGARLSDLRVADRRQRRGAGADTTCARRAISPSIRAELEAKITPQTRLLILNSPHNPTGGEPASRRSRRDRRDPAQRIRRSGCSPTKSIRACATTANSPRSRRCPACSSARSSRTAHRRPGR